jgi:pimeloyl-ACP methyl ester carboxylesterase
LSTARSIRYGRKRFLPGETDAPPNILDYTHLQIVGDIVGLVHALGYEEAVIAGHDLGAIAAYNAAILRPDMFRALILLSVPYGARTEGAVLPTEGMRRRAPEGQQFYQLYFQMPGVAEEELDADPKRSLRMFLYSLSGSIPKEHKWRYIFGVNEKALDGCTEIFGKRRCYRASGTGPSKKRLRR